jgi:hypothetical protein
MVSIRILKSDQLLFLRLYWKSLLFRSYVGNHMRHALAALSRRSWATAQLTGELLAHLEWWRAYYHFCRPHLSLRLKVEVPLARRGKQTPRRYGPRTPAMAAGLTDHIWSVQELLAFPVGGCVSVCGDGSAGRTLRQLTTQALPIRRSVRHNSPNN